jgi:hypothetical protein
MSCFPGFAPTPTLPQGGGRIVLLNIEDDGRRCILVSFKGFLTSSRSRCFNLKPYRFAGLILFFDHLPGGLEDHRNIVIMI